VTWAFLFGEIEYDAFKASKSFRYPYPFSLISDLDNSFQRLGNRSLHGSPPQQVQPPMLVIAAQVV